MGEKVGKPAIEKKILSLAEDGRISIRYDNMII